MYTVFARTGEALGAEGLSAFLMPAVSSRLQIAERLDTFAPHPLARIVFDKAQIPANAPIRRVGGGFGVSMAVLDVFCCAAGSAAVGTGHIADMAKRHATETV